MFPTQHFRLLILLSVLKGNPLNCAQDDFMTVPLQRNIQWNRIFSLTDARHWQPEQRLPCYRDTVILPDDYAIFLDEELETEQLVSCTGILLLLLSLTT